MAGIIGHLLILTAFVACGLSGAAYLRASRESATSEWFTVARAAWAVMAVCTIGAFVVLGYTVVTHQFQYAYVYEHSSRALPVHFLISATWAGQEGSFLLWIILNGVVGLGLIRWARDYEATTMAVIALCQIFLISMVVGLKIGAVPIGSSPFMTLAEKFPDAPMLKAGLVPADGSGLNDLLQNYWMVIHPPTLFVGFATMIVPFAYAVSAVWKRRYTDWVRPALPWTLFAVMILGVGIAMGGYWAYVTLSFGGYWAWDPVENSSLVPWLIGIAAVHTMIIQKRSGTSHKAALFLCILAYMFVVYSTFLTRSGILGDISVHSFVDLGLYNQLLLWILTMGVVGFGLFAYRYKELPRPRQEPGLLSRETMIFVGAMLICATALVVILGTSAPILGRIFRDNPSTVPIAFYNKWSLPLSIGFVFLAGLGQLFWWNKMSIENANKVLLKPVALAVVSTIAVLLFTPFVEESVRSVPPANEVVAMTAGIFDGLGGHWQAYGPGLLLLLLLFVAFFALYGNGFVMWRVARGNPKLAGGALAHVGFALLVIGIIASSGFSNTVAPVDPSTGVQRDNFVLNRGQTARVAGYTVTYVGKEISSQNRPAYLLDVTDPSGSNYMLKPVSYESSTQQWIQHPDVRLGARKDLFVAVSPNEMFEDGSASGTTTVALRKGEEVQLGGGEYSVAFVAFDLDADGAHISEDAQIVVGAELRITRLSDGRSETVIPVYSVGQDGAVQIEPAEIPDFGISVGFTGMNVDSGAVNISFIGVEGPREDWILIQAYEKPLINVVWIGIILLSIGFVLSIYRRAQEANRSRLSPA
ncbi:MAG: cytochrome c biogenesis protein CcsA [Rhodothermia bacterium]|nr:cytochrome c biogenesis protein CcsA [Rhodothermia bacterium]NNL47236.1 cytochrome c biogenesis protein CcsA [Acidimicrobiia bacterium]